MRRLARILVVAVVPTAPVWADAACQQQCWSNYQSCQAAQVGCLFYCAACEPAYQTCQTNCCLADNDVCTLCSRPDASDHDGDLVPDALEFDLANRFFPEILMTSSDVPYFYPRLGKSLPFRVRPIVGGVCDEPLECLELRFGVAYQYDLGSIPIFDDGHLGDSEFYAAVVQRNSTWSMAAAEPSRWMLIRDFTAAHWGALGDSSRVAVYGGCSWSSPLPYNCYPVPAAAPPVLYAAKNKHGLYHSDAECDAGGYTTDDCPTGLVSTRSLVVGRLQNIGELASHDPLWFDTTIQDPTWCGKIDVWNPDIPFGSVTSYGAIFEAGLTWFLGL